MKDNRWTWQINKKGIKETLDKKRWLMDPALYFLEKSSSSRANGWFSEFIAPELDDANQRPGWWSRWWCCWSWLAGYWRWTGWEDHLVDLSSARPQPPASSVSGKPLYLPLTYLHSKRWWCGTNHKETTTEETQNKRRSATEEQQNKYNQPNEKHKT